MRLPSHLHSYRRTLRAYISGFLQEKQFKDVGPWGNDATARLRTFVLAGKGVRGSLALFSYSAFAKKKNIEEALPLACALELFHAGLLIQDDIMDKDEKRRGMPSMHMQYTPSGQNMAICVGALALFLGYDALSRLPSGNDIFTTVSRELTHVAVAQMSDVTPAQQPSAKDILQTYVYKTARYTFSLPLATGALLAGASSAATKQLEELGEHLGILFQIRDDELDVGEEKQTLATVVNNIDAIKKEHKEKAEKSIRALPISPTDEQTLLSLLTFVLTRTR